MTEQEFQEFLKTAHKELRDSMIVGGYGKLVENFRGRGVEIYLLNKTIENTEGHVFHKMCYGYRLAAISPEGKSLVSEATI
jgi:hypothetical protein